MIIAIHSIAEREKGRGPSPVIFGVSQLGGLCKLTAATRLQTKELARKDYEG